MKPTEEQIKKLEQEIEELKKRVKALENWQATHHCPTLPPNIKRVIGKPMPDSGVIIPEVYDEG